MEKTMSGKKSSSLHPSAEKIKPVDPKVAVLLGVSFPIALLAFWNITLPFLTSTFSLILGIDVVQTVFYLKEDIMNTMFLPCPNWLSAEERAFIMNSSPEIIRRVKNLNSQEFKEFVNTGEPLVVSDAMEGWPGFGVLNCQSFIARYPDAKYFDWQEHTDTELKYITKRKGYKDLECASGNLNSDVQENSTLIQDWFRQVKVPYFLSQFTKNDEFLNISQPNMDVFVGAPHTGIPLHVDETCYTYMSAQFSGVKNWSLSWPIMEGDKLRWSKPIVFTVYPGEVLIWHVGMKYHTEVIEDCSLSFTFQITTPAPRDYFQNLYKTINSVPNADRKKLFMQSYDSDFSFLNSCKINIENGKTFISKT